jgi:hypothetical protein
VTTADVLDLTGAHVEGQRVRLSLLDPAGTPIPDATRWDDDVRVKATPRYRRAEHPLGGVLDYIEVHLIGGDDNTWSWLAEHIGQDSRVGGLIHPFAIELWLPQGEQWRRHRLPRIHVDDTDPWEFSAHENPNWPDDEDLPEGFAQRSWSWRRAERLPSDAPEPVTA